MDLDVLRFCGESQALLVLLGGFNKQERRVFRSSGSLDLLRSLVQLCSPLWAFYFSSSHLCIPITPPFTSLTSTFIPILSSPSHVSTMSQARSSSHSLITCNITLWLVSHFLFLFIRALLFYQFTIRNSLRNRMRVILKLKRRIWSLSVGLLLDLPDEMNGGCGRYIFASKQFDLKFILWLERKQFWWDVFTCWFPSSCIHVSPFRQFLHALLHLLVTALQSIGQIPYCSSNCIPYCIRSFPNCTPYRGEHTSQELKLAARESQEQSQHQQ